MKKSCHEMGGDGCRLVDLLVYLGSLGLAVSLVMQELDPANMIDYSLS